MTGFDPIDGSLWGDGAVQTTQPRDYGALAFVVGLFIILLVVAVVLGQTPR